MKKLITVVVSALCAAVSCVSFADQISVTPSDFAAKVAAANDGDVFVFSAGAYGLSAEIAVSGKTGLSFVGATDGETVITRAEGADIRFFNLDGCSDITFSRLTFKDGHYVAAAAPEAPMGGAMLIANCTAVKVLDCKFFDNYCTSIAGDNVCAYGGAICSHASVNTEIRRCEFAGNVVNADAGTSDVDSKRASCGGAVAAFRTGETAGSILLDSCVLTNNCATGGRGSFFGGNSPYAGAFGAAVDIHYATGAMTNCIVMYNRAYSTDWKEISGSSAVEIRVTSDATSYFANNTIAFNEAQCGAIVYVPNKTSFRFGNNVIRGHRYDCYMNCEGTSLHTGSVYGKTFTHPLYTYAESTVAGKWSDEDPFLGPNGALLAGSPAVGYGSALVGTWAPRTLTVNPGGGAQYASLAAALAEAKPGDTISLAAGTYTPTTEGVSAYDLTDCRHLRIVGAGKDQTVFDFADETTTTPLFTLLRCFDVSIEGLSVRNLTFTGLASAKAFFCQAQQCGGICIADCAVEKCTLSDALVTDAVTSYGAFRFMQSGLCEMHDCDIVDNEMDFTHKGKVVTVNGFAVSSYGSGFVGGNCRVTGNTLNATAASVLHLFTGDSFGEACGQTVKNALDKSGLNIYVNSLSGTFSIFNSLIADNNVTGSASTDGSVGNSVNLANYTVSSVVNFENCTVISNNVGSLLHPSRYGKVVVVNSVFGGLQKFAWAANSATGKCGDGATENCLALPDMESVVLDSRTSMPRVSTNGLVYADAKFKNVAKGDYHLVEVSPAIDKMTTPSSWMTLAEYWAAKDLDGNPRVQHPTKSIKRAPYLYADWGCYEFHKGSGLLLLLK